MRIGWKTSVTVVAAFALGVLGGVTSAKSAKPEYTLIPAGSAKFAPVDPKNAAGPQMAQLSGDPKTGPAAFFIKLPKGQGPAHWHTSDYYLLTVEGKMKHFLPGKDADAKENPAGSFWFQPSGSTGQGPHIDECLTDSCTLFVFMPNKFDYNPVAAPAKK